MFDTYFFICFIDEVISSLRSLKSSIFVMNAMIIPEPREINISNICWNFLVYRSK